MAILARAWDTYKEYLREINWRIEPRSWAGLSVLTGLGVLLLTLFLLLQFGLTNLFIIAPILFFVIVDLMVGYPYLLAQRRIDQIEEFFPDALKQMSDTLKAGGTFEYALHGISTAQYGPLTEEMDLVLRRLEQGENLHNALRSFSRNIHSRIVKRAVNIILDSIEAGAGLADILDQIADDVKATYRIKQERKSTTLMQVLFMVTAGAIVAPFIFGLVSVIIGFLMDVSRQTLGLTGPEVLAQEAKKNQLLTVLQSYIFVMGVSTGVMLSMIREGNITKSIIYIPVVLLVAFLVYFGSMLVVGTVLGA